MEISEKNSKDGSTDKSIARSIIISRKSDLVWLVTFIGLLIPFFIYGTSLVYGWIDESFVATQISETYVEILEEDQKKLYKYQLKLNNNTDHVTTIIGSKGGCVGAWIEEEVPFTISPHSEKIITVFYSAYRAESCGSNLELYSDHSLSNNGIVNFTLKRK